MAKVRNFCFLSGEFNVIVIYTSGSRAQKLITKFYNY